MKNNFKIVHEKYHKKTGISRMIIAKNNFTYRLIISILDKYMKGRNKILDIGCGAGSISFYLTSKGNDILGIDISKKAISECEKSIKLMGLKNVKFLQCDFPGLKISTKFDAVVFTEVIEHLPDDMIALKKINNLLKNNGFLFMSTPSINAPLHKLGFTTKFDRDVGHLRRYELESLKKIIIGTGFRIVETKKTEGIFRNILYINPLAGKLVRILNYSGFLSDIATFVDNITMNLFGESNYIIVARKVGKKNKTQKIVK